jgi:mannitol/fructose-specific phosphotransferase system IIA component (Ntr-type)
MHPLINHMIQLQELSLIRAEQKMISGMEHLEQLDTSIRDLTLQLPSEVAARFAKQQKNDPIVVAPISQTICSMCGMALPVSLIQAVRLAREIHSCPSCARLLYFSTEAPRRLGPRPRRMDAPKIGISRFSSETLMVPQLKATDKEGAIRELALTMESSGFVDKSDRLIELALAREATLSTGLDHGLAFPHARGIEGGGLGLALGLSQKGIDFKGPVKGLTKMVFFIVIPTAASAFYLKLLSGLMETFVKADARKALMAEKDPEKMWKTLTKLTKATIK